MKILVTNLFGSFEAEFIEYTYMGEDVSGIRAKVTDSKLDGWRNGEIIELGTLSRWKFL